MLPRTAPLPDPTDPTDRLDDSRYLALAARDARFDGRFFTGVTSTGIYCRPVCSVRTPRRENCRFFTLAAQAEGAGFRPCLRCRPELAPRALVWSTQDAQGILVREALRLLEADADNPPPQPDHGGPAEGGATMQALAARLGVSDRHLRRIFDAALGVSPLQYLQTRRLLTAKQLLTDTDLPVTQVAMASGFQSLRRFNAAFAQHYGLNPSQLRKTGSARQGPLAGAVRLAYRPPLDVPALLAFFAKRQIHAVEEVVDTAKEQVLRRTVHWTAGGREVTGWLSAQFDPVRPLVLLRTSDSLHPVLPQVIARVRALLDLDADPSAINAVLHADFPQGDGLRVPGAFDGFELAVRAVLGQQITVAAARTLAQRLVERFGEPIVTPWPALSRLFPRPAVLARAEGDALGQLAAGTAWHGRHPSHHGGPVRTARHWRLDGAVHRDAGTALARCLSRRRRGAAQGARRAGPTPACGCGCRGIAGLAALAQLRRRAGLGTGRNRITIKKIAASAHPNCATGLFHLENHHHAISCRHRAKPHQHPLG